MTVDFGVTSKLLSFCAAASTLFAGLDLADLAACLAAFFASRSALI